MQHLNNKNPDSIALLKSVAFPAADLKDNNYGNYNLETNHNDFELVSQSVEYILTKLICSNERIMSADAIRYLEEMRSSNLITPKEIYLYSFIDAYLLPNGVISIGRKIVLETLETLPSSYYTDPVWDYYNKISIDLQPNPEFYSIDKPILVIEQPGIFNYGHWLIEIFPKIIYLKNEILLEKIIITMPSMYKEWTFINSMLEFLGIYTHNIIWHNLSIINLGQVIQIKRLFYVSPISKHQHPGYISPWSINQILQETQSIPGNTEKRIFVSRQDATSRFLLNENELAEILSLRGYSIIQTALLSFEDQIKIFKGASHVIGVFGASMTNIVFCQPGTRVLMIPPGNSIDHFYWDLASIRGLEYFYFNGSPAPKQDNMLNCDFTINIIDFNKFLNLFDGQT